MIHQFRGDGGLRYIVMRHVQGKTSAATSQDPRTDGGWRELGAAGFWAGEAGIWSRGNGDEHAREPDGVTAKPVTGSVPLRDPGRRMTITHSSCVRARC